MQRDCRRVGYNSLSQLRPHTQFEGSLLKPCGNNAKNKSTLSMQRFFRTTESSRAGQGQLIHRENVHPAHFMCQTGYSSKKGVWLNLSTPLSIVLSQLWILRARNSRDSSPSSPAKIVYKRTGGHILGLRNNPRWLRVDHASSKARLARNLPHHGGRLRLQLAGSTHQRQRSTYSPPRQALVSRSLCTPIFFR